MIRVVLPFYSEFETAKPGLRALRESGIAHELFPVQGVGVDENRNLGVNEGRSFGTKQLPVTGFSHFLFIDSDIGFEVKHLERLLWHNQAICALPYLRRDGTEYQAGHFDADGKPEWFYNTTARGFSPVDFVGAGFILVRADVFPRLRYPWFRREVLTARDESWQDSGDYGFCRNARACGYRVMCDFDFPVFHKPRAVADFDVSY